jgi:hypothetical protein
MKLKEFKALVLSFFIILGTLALAIGGLFIDIYGLPITFWILLGVGFSLMFIVIWTYVYDIVKDYIK